MESALKILEQYYGYKSFRKNQEEVIKSILDKNDTVAIMPTGAGKSICYQIPALVFDGITIVVSPLISLMKDQVDALKELNISAAYINSTLSRIELEEVLYGIKNYKYKLIYVAPERLETEEFIDVITKIDVSQVAIDEAHCISQWGHDFRSSYRKIPWFISKLINKPIVTAFTATASEEVRNDIVKLLQLDNPKVHIGGFDRENLEITIVKEGNKEKYLNEYIDANSHVSGIIYCATRKEVDELYTKLKNRNLAVSKYHAGMNENDRSKNQEEFINDTCNIMIATNAFGMGIDKPNIRYVIHNNMPQTIENYYQEIGRAGRDGEKSECVLLFTPGDIHLQKYLIDNSIESESRRLISYEKLQDMRSLVYSKGCYRKVILNYFGEEYNKECNNCSNCLSEGETVDKTIDTQKVLSCIYRMKRGYGTTVLVDVLRGSKNSKIISLGFDKLSTYGIMKDYKKDELTSFINALISHGYIDVVGGTYPVLALNNLSIDVIKGNEKVFFKEVKKVEKKYKVNELFNELKELRYKISKEQGVPPYVIFGDNSLKEMSNLYPINDEEFLQIIGVGQLKLDKYGKQFMDVIKEYMTKNSIEKESLNQDKKEKIELDKLYICTDEELFNRLKEKRAEFANKERKLPSSLIHQDTLKEISGRYPMSLDELKDISGFGTTKISKYGEAIIEIVKDYVEEKNIERNWVNKGKTKVVIDNEERSHIQVALDMIEEGYDISIISEKIEYSISTILGYITDYIKEGNKLKASLELEQFYDVETERLISEQCELMGIDKVGEIKKALPKEIKYEAIRAVILKKYYGL